MTEREIPLTQKDQENMYKDSRYKDAFIDFRGKGEHPFTKKVIKDGVETVEGEGFGFTPINSSAK